MSLKQYYTTHNYLPLLLIAFLLPFNFGVAIVLVMSLFAFFVLGDVRTGMKTLVSNKWTYVFLLFFFLHALGYFFSDNKKEALTAIEIKLGFIAFPLLLFTQEFNRIDIRKVLRFFAYGTVVCTLFNVTRAFYFYLFQHESKYLFYSEFSFFMHPGYFAMYCVFSIMILSVLGINYFKAAKHNVLLVIMCCLVLALGVFMSASKMGMLSLFVLLPVLLFYVLFKRKKYILLAAIIVLVSLSSFFVLRTDFAPVQRLRNAFDFAGSGRVIDKTTSESNAVRVLIWNEAATIIKNNLLLGVTPGDANDALYTAYEKNGMTGALEKHLNAHNQFLQTTLGTGIIGGILLVFLTVGVLVAGFTRREVILVLFGLIITINFLVESMLQTQAGTLFFVFLAPILLVNTGNVNKRYL